MEIGSDSWNHLIADGADEFGIPIASDVMQKFSVYAKELIAWNQKINLTAITDPFEIAVKHFIDSIAPASLIKPDDVLIDIGSGGGFPGIPLALLYPSLRATLIDTSRKKVNFLKHIGRILQIDNLSVIQIRAEDVLKKDVQFAGNYTVAISRALFPLEKLISTALPILSGNGKIIAMKGRTNDVDKTIREVEKQLRDRENGHLERRYEYAIYTYRLKQIGATRSIIHFTFHS